MGKKSRTKGKTGELEIVKLLKPLFPDVARELSQYQESGVVDLKNTGPYVVQVKRRKARPGVEKMLLEVAEHVNAPEIPMLMIRGDGGEWLVVMYADDWVASAL